MASTGEESLVVAAKKSSDHRHVALHPLVLLHISDHVTRNVMREQQEPVVGIIMGQESGREVTMEFACDMQVLPMTDEPSKGLFTVKPDFFTKRLHQSKASPTEQYGGGVCGPRQS